MVDYKEDGRGMHPTVDFRLAEEVLRLRLSQMAINERYKNKEFKIPIHLALGHEAIAVAVSATMTEADQLVLSHRNIHYNLARHPSLKAVLDEFYLRENGLAGGRLGSMNLANAQAGIVYTSSILGNNLCVAAGLALGNKIKGNGGIVSVVTGDGAIEEGAFYESLAYMKSLGVHAILVVEDNNWSMATQIHERRCAIHLSHLAAAIDVPYFLLAGNDPYLYHDELRRIRELALQSEGPVVVQVELQTLGDWRAQTDRHPEGKFINYHAGPSPSVQLGPWPLIQEHRGDPLFVLLDYFDAADLKGLALDVLGRLEEECS